jgi:hypothetical protein
VTAGAAKTFAVEYTQNPVGEALQIVSQQQISTSS